MYKDSKSKTAAIICYLFAWIGWIIAFIIRDKDDALSGHHLNQALVIHIATTLVNLLLRIGGIIAVLAEVADIGLFVLAIMGLVRAAKGSDEPLPIIGDIKLI